MKVGISAGQAHGNSKRGKFLLQTSGIGNTKMENAGCQRRIGAAPAKYIGKMADISRPS